MCPLVHGITSRLLGVKLSVDGLVGSTVGPCRDWEAGGQHAMGEAVLLGQQAAALGLWLQQRPVSPSLCSGTFQRPSVLLLRFALK